MCLARLWLVLKLIPHWEQEWGLFPSGSLGCVARHLSLVTLSLASPLRDGVNDSTHGALLLWVGAGGLWLECSGKRSSKFESGGSSMLQSPSGSFLIKVRFRVRGWRVSAQLVWLVEASWPWYAVFPGSTLQSSMTPKPVLLSWWRPWFPDSSLRFGSTRGTRRKWKQLNNCIIVKAIVTADSTTTAHSCGWMMLVLEWPYRGHKKTQEDGQHVFNLQYPIRQIHSNNTEIEY